MDAESPPLKMDELLREYAEFLRQSNDEVDLVHLVMLA